MKRDFLVLILAVTMTAGVLAWKQGPGDENQHTRSLSTRKERVQTINGTIANHVPLLRRKRGIGSIISKLFSVGRQAIPRALQFSSKVVKRGGGAFEIASLSYTFANAVSAGCASFPRICKNKKRIEVLENNCTSLAERIVEIYDSHQDRRDFLFNITLNNLYLEHYIGRISEQILNLEQLKIEFAYGNTSLSNSSKENLNIPSEICFQSLVDYLNSEISRAYKTVGIHIGVKLTLMALKIPFKKISNRLQSKFNLKPNNLKFQKLKNVGKSIKTKFPKVYGNFRSISKSMKKVISLSNILGVTAGSIMIALEHQRWKEVDEKLEKAKQALIEHEALLRSNLQGLLATNENPDAHSLIKEQVWIFNNVTNAIDDISIDYEDYGPLLKSLAPNISLSLWGHRNEDTILSKQETLRRELEQAGKTLQNAKRWMSTIAIVTNLVRHGTSRNASVAEIHQSIKNRMLYENDDVMARNKRMLSLPAVVCIICFTHPNQTSYRTYPLDTIRDTCQSEIPQKFTGTYLAYRQRFAVQFMIKKAIERETQRIISSSDDVCDVFWLPRICSLDMRTALAEADFTIQIDDTISQTAKTGWKELLCHLPELFPQEDTIAFFDLNKLEEACLKRDNRQIDSLASHALHSHTTCLHQEKEKAARRCLGSASPQTDRQHMGHVDGDEPQMNVGPLSQGQKYVSQLQGQTSVSQANGQTKPRGLISAVLVMYSVMISLHIYTT